MLIRILAQLLYAITIIIESLLSVRFILRLVNANSSISFINWLYRTTDYVLQPIRGVVVDKVIIWGFTVDLTTLLMLFILMLVAYALYEIIEAFE